MTHAHRGNRVLVRLAPSVSVGRGNCHRVVIRVPYIYETLVENAKQYGDMSRKKPPPHVVKLVWRITDEAPMGEYVDANAPRKASDLNAAEGRSPGWTDSSFDLLHGADVTHDPEDLPPDLLHELFRDDDGPLV